MMRGKLALLAFALAAAMTGSAARADVSVPYRVKVHHRLTVVLNPVEATIYCNAPPGTLVSKVSTIGGNHKPVKFVLIAGDTADFAVVGSDVLVGADGVDPANCGKVPTVTVSAVQEP